MDLFEIEDLRNEIRKHDHAYYTLSKPAISDYEYDLLVKKLEEVEKKYPELITKDSPTQRVGNDQARSFKKAAHSKKMMSISNIYSIEELLDFDRKVKEGLAGENLNGLSYVSELKIDGVAIALRYDKGLLQAGITRGDGTTGDDVTANVRTIKGIPLSIHYQWPLEVRGEIYMDRKTFNEINEGLSEDEKLQNPRNTASGTLKQLDPKKVASRKLKFWAHFAIGPDWEKEHHANLTRLRELGFPVNPHSNHCKDINTVIEYCNVWDKKRTELDFDIDGIVVKVNSIDQHNKLGVTAKSPRWVIAYKYKPEAAITELLAIDHQVGRTGVITPVARLKPVFLSGSTISNATLHNYDEIYRLDIRVGDFVYLEKGGEIIPKITGIDKSKRKPDAPKPVPPETCPVCKGKTVTIEGEVAVRCENSYCPAQIQGAIEHFVSRAAMNISDVGPALIEQFLKAGFIQDWADLYYLTRESLLSLERMGEKSANNVLNAIEGSKKASLDRIIFAMGIRHLGAESSRTLASTVKNLWEIKDRSVENLKGIPDVGPVVAQSIYDWFHVDTNLDKLRKLELAGISFENKQEPVVVSPISGKNIVVTGSLEKFSRSEIEEFVRKNGGKAGSSVSKKTDFVVVGTDAGSKLTKAQELGVKILSEAEFLTLCGQ